MGVLDRLNATQKISGTRVFMRDKGYRDFLYPVGEVTPKMARAGGTALSIGCGHMQAGRGSRRRNYREHTLVTALTIGDSGPCLEVMRGGITAERLRSPVVVAADGAASRLAFQAGKAVDVSEGLGFAIAAITKESPDWEIY